MESFLLAIISGGLFGGFVSALINSFVTLKKERNNFFKKWLDELSENLVIFLVNCEKYKQIEKKRNKDNKGKDEDEKIKRDFNAPEFNDFLMSSFKLQLTIDKIIFDEIKELNIKAQNDIKNIVTNMHGDIVQSGDIEYSNYYNLLNKIGDILRTGSDNIAINSQLIKINLLADGIKYLKKNK